MRKEQAPIDAAQPGVTDRMVSVELRIDKQQTMQHVSKLRDLLREWGLTLGVQESLWVVSYDGVQNLRTITPIAVGTYHNVVVSIPAILSAVLLSGTDRFLVVHNHPNGVVQPTELDFELTIQIMNAAATVGLYFEDHIIVGPPDQWHSMAQAREFIPSKDLEAMVAAGARTRKAGEPIFPTLQIE
jgi:DNA repair protein RadC